MRFLYVDIGNTALKWALFENEKLTQKWTTNKDILPLDLPKIDALCIANVGLKDISFIINYFASQTILVLQLNEQGKWAYNNKVLPLPITIRYQTPHTLGADRLACAIAAHHLFPEDAVLAIDFGTCLKYEVIHNHAYLGGAIAPGVLMRYQAMAQFTQKLPLLAIPEQQVFCLGENTQNALHAGVICAVEAEIMGMKQQYEKLLGKEMKVIISGGQTNYFEKYTKISNFAEPNLVLYGLHVLSQFVLPYL